MAKSTKSDSKKSNTKVEAEKPQRERKSWNFGHFGTRHDGEVWNLVRVKNEFGTAITDGEVVATNKSATPLVALAREMSRVEKRDLRIIKLTNQITQLTAELNDLVDDRDREDS